MAKPQILVDISNIKDSINTLFQKVKKGTGQISNLSANWEDVVGIYNKKYSFIIEGVTSSDVVDIALDKNSVDVAINAEMCPTTESYNGGVYIYTKTIPTDIITFNYIVFK